MLWTLSYKKRSQSEQKYKFLKIYLQKPRGRGILPTFKIMWILKEKFRSRFKKWNKNSTTNYTRKNICTSSNFFRYFFEGTQFLKRGREFIEFSPKSERFALSASKLSESQRKTSASGPKYRQKDCRNKILKKRSKWSNLMILKCCWKTLRKKNQINEPIYRSIFFKHSKCMHALGKL